MTQWLSDLNHDSVAVRPKTRFSSRCVGRLPISSALYEVPAPPPLPCALPPPSAPSPCQSLGSLRQCAVPSLPRTARVGRPHSCAPGGWRGQAGVSSTHHAQETPAHSLHPFSTCILSVAKPQTTSPTCVTCAPHPGACSVTLGGLQPSHAFHEKVTFN